MSSYGIWGSTIYLFNQNRYQVMEADVVEIYKVGYRSPYLCKVICYSDSKIYTLSSRVKDHVGDRVLFYIDSDGLARWTKPCIPNNSGISIIIIVALSGIIIVIMEIHQIKRKKLIKTQVLYKKQKIRKDICTEYAVCIGKDEKGRDHFFKTYIGKCPIEYEVKDEVYFLVDPKNYHNYEIVMADELNDLLSNSRITK